MSPRITHIDPEETIRKLKAKVDRLEKALAKQPAQQALDKMAENARELGIQMQPAQQQEIINGRTVKVDWKAQALELRELVRLGGIKIAELEAELAEQPAQPQQVPVAWMYDRARYGPTDLRGQQWLPELSRLKPYTGNGMVRGLIPLYTHPQACELEQVEKDLRFHGLTLVKTATGYAVLKLGHITAHGIKENT